METIVSILSDRTRGFLFIYGIHCDSWTLCVDFLLFNGSEHFILPCYRMCLFILLAMAVALGKEPSISKEQIPIVSPFFMVSGALLTDNFDAPQLDATLWSRPGWLVENHKTIDAKIENGHLVISGVSHPEKKDHQYAGVISKYFRDTDVVLVAEIQAKTACKEAGRIQHMLHLCSGDYPDFFTEVIFGKIQAIETPRWYTAYVAAIWEYSGYRTYLKPVHAATGLEGNQWHTVVLTHDDPDSKTQNYLILGGQWVPIGPAHSVRFNHTHIELKVDVNIPDVPVEMQVDNVRLYPNPAHHPVTIVIYTGVSGNKPKSPIFKQKVQIFKRDSEELLGEALSDEGGEARVIVRRDVVYPVSARIVVSDGATAIAQSEILSKDVKGLYPGDVWALYLRHKRAP